MIRVGAGVAHKGAGDGLWRFHQAQERGDPAAFATALMELEAGAKRSHWIWYVFPQLRGLGRSRHAQMYGLDGVSEARAYLRDPLLCERYGQCLAALLGHLQRGRSLDEVVGSTDALKVISSVTLFQAAMRLETTGGAATGAELPARIEQFLAWLTAHGGELCRHTLQVIG